MTRLTASNLVDALLEGTVQIDTARLDALWQRLRKIQNPNVRVFVRKANALLRPFRIRYVRDLTHDAIYSSSDDTIYLRYPVSSEAAVGSFLDKVEHEEVHRQQYRAARRTKPIYPPIDASSQKGVAAYMLRSHEMMANAATWVNRQLRAGKTKEQLLNALRSRNVTRSGSGEWNIEGNIEAWYPIFQKRGPENQRSQANRFFNYAYDYLTKLDSSAARRRPHRPRSPSRGTGR